MSHFFVQFGFKTSKSDTSLFIYSTPTIQTYFLVYVDDLIITRNSSTFITDFIVSLSNQFIIKDLGSLYYFLGVEVITTISNLFLFQHKYIWDLLQWQNMDGTKYVASLLSILSPMSPRLISTCRCYSILPSC